MSLTDSIPTAKRSVAEETWPDRAELLRQVFVLHSITSGREMTQFYASGCCKLSKLQNLLTVEVAVA